MTESRHQQNEVERSRSGQPEAVVDGGLHAVLMTPVLD